MQTGAGVELCGFLLGQEDGEERVCFRASHASVVDAVAEDGVVVVDGAVFPVIGVVERADVDELVANSGICSRSACEAIAAGGGVVPVAPFRLVALLAESCLRLPGESMVWNVVTGCSVGPFYGLSSVS